MKNIELDKKVEQIEGKNRVLSGFQLKFVAFIAFLWSLFQLWHASPLPFTLGFGVFIDLPARAIHLGFALFIAFLAFPLLLFQIKAHIILKSHLHLQLHIL